MSNLLVTIVAFVAVLGVLVFVHELGHFSAAKLFGVRVQEFALGFPPRFAGFRRGETLYSLNVIPVGGFVKMTGENGDEADDPRSFGAKPWWQRAIILTAGPAMNILLALFLFFVTFAFIGTPMPTTGIASVASGSPAATAGIRAGDTIVAVDRRQVSTGFRLRSLIIHHAGESIPVTVLRKGQDLTVMVTPRLQSQIPNGQGAIGIEMQSRPELASVRHSITASFQQTWGMVTLIPHVIAGVGQSGGSGQVSGPVGIARDTGQAASLGPGALFFFMALLSANLGVLNLLPMPALDGGRLVFVFFAGIRRRNVNPKVEGMVHLVGMAALLLFMLLISSHDIANWVSGQ